MSSAAIAPLVDPFNFFQIAYVTSDVDRATAELGKLYGIPRFQILRDLRLGTGKGVLHAHFALAFIDEQQIEVIQPLGGDDRLYREALTESGFIMRLHHFGHRVTSAPAWKRIVAAVQTSGLAVPVQSLFPDPNAPMMHFMYVDARETLGHYLELMYQTEAGRHMFADVPRYSRA